MRPAVHREKMFSRGTPMAWTHRMLAGCRTTRVVQVLDIVRDGPPEKGRLFFDKDGILIYIIDGFVNDPRYGNVSNHFTWRRVLVNGELSKRSFSGYWDWGNYRDKRIR